MVKFVLLTVAGVMVASTASAQVSVRGHVRRDGTYVAPHMRTAPNRSTMDNWSTRPNVNPYNGRQGTVTPSSPYNPPRSSQNNDPWSAGVGDLDRGF